MMYSPRAQETPMAAVTQIPAAVVMPWTLPRPWMMAPAPRKPTPPMTPWTMREMSMCRAPSA
jgi:hypothetical protein